MAGIDGKWQEALKEEFRKPYYRELYGKVLNAYRTETVYPPADEIFTAFHLTPLDKVKVVILGQDPYHEPGQAQGLAFYVPPEIQTPPSLVNIAKELNDDLGHLPTTNYQLLTFSVGPIKVSFFSTRR